MNTLLITLIVAVAYMMGNISPAIILGRLHGIDIKKEGSGNAGTTNVLRVIGKKAAVLTMVIDILKGVLAVQMGFFFGGMLEDPAGSFPLGYYVGAACAIAAFCGHIWPCLYHFKGGKGVATAFGVIVSMNWMLGLAVLGVVALGVILSKRMSVGSILGAAMFPVLCYFIEPGFVGFGIVMAIIVIVKHRANIGRLLRGEEPKMSFKK